MKKLITLFIVLLSLSINSQSTDRVDALKFNTPKVKTDFTGTYDLIPLMRGSGKMDGSFISADSLVLKSSLKTLEQSINNINSGNSNWTIYPISTSNEDSLIPNYSDDSNTSSVDSKSSIVTGKSNQLGVSSGRSGIIGGTENSTNGWQSFIGGGFSNLIGDFANNSSIIGGNDLTLEGYQSFMAGGNQNSITTSSIVNSLILGGQNNELNGLAYNSSILGGASNNNNQGDSSILAGTNNSIIGGSGQSIILGGSDNELIDSNKGLISTSSSSTITNSNNSLIIGGVNNEIGSNTFNGGLRVENSAIIGGSDNTASLSDSFIASSTNGESGALYSSIISSRDSNTDFSGTHSSIISSWSSRINASNSVILAGTNNDMELGTTSAIIGSTESSTDNSLFSVLLAGIGNNAFNRYEILGGLYGTEYDLDNLAGIENKGYRLFNLGNGSVANRNNAFSVYQNGDTRTDGVSESGFFKLSEINTPPSSLTDTGIEGELRFTTEGLYICTATDTWIRIDNTSNQNTNNSYVFSTGLIENNGTVEIDNSTVILKDSLIVKRHNLFNINDLDVKLDSYVNFSNGNVQSATIYNATGYIEVNPSTVYTLSYKHQIAWFDENKNYISGSNSNFTYPIRTSPSNAAYLRCTVHKDEWKKFQVVEGNTELEYDIYGYKIKDEYLDEINTLQFESKLGKNGNSVTQASLSDGNSITVTNFPRHLKKGLSMSMSCNFTSFTGSVEFGKGIGDYRGDWLKIDNTNIYWQNYESTETTKATVAHGLTLDTFLKGSLFIDDNSIAHVVIYTLTDTFETTFNWVYEANHEPFIKTTGQDLTNVTLNCTSKEFQHPVWAFGDSYFGVYENRWIGQLKDLGYFNLLINGLAGQNSLNAYDDLVRSLNYGTPKYLVWCLGMNDSDTNYINTLNSLIDLCENKGIELVLATVPTVPTRDKEVISNAVVNSGYRFIDFYEAMGANSSGQWYTGYLNGDGIHPNVIGAKGQAIQFLINFPEIMQYGKINFENMNTNNTTNDN